MCPSAARTDMAARRARTCCGCKAWRSVYETVAAYFRDEQLRTAFSFHPLLIGGNPFATTGIYSLISHLERRWGVHWAMGGTGSAGARHRRADRGPGRQRCAATPRWPRSPPSKAGRATGVRLADGEVIPADVVVSNADAAWTYRQLLPGLRRRRAGPTRSIGRARYSMSLFVWYFGTRRRYEPSATTPSCSARATAGCCSDIFDAARCWPMISACTCTAPPRPTRRWRRAGCDAFYVLSPVPHLGSGIDWADRGGTLSPGHRAAAARAPLLPGPSSSEHRHLARDHAAGFPRPPAVGQRRRLRAGAGAAAERLVPPAQPQRGGGAASTSSAPARIPAPASPACSPRPKVLDKVVPHAHALA